MKPQRLLSMRVVGPLVWLTLSSSAVRAAPSTPSIELEYQAPALCPSRERVELELRRLLAGSNLKAVVKSQIVVAEQAAGYSVRLVLLEPVSGARTIEHHSCSQALKAAALVVALSVDADAVARDQATASTLDDPGTETSPKQGDPAQPPGDGATRSAERSGTQSNLTDRAVVTSYGPAPSPDADEPPGPAAKASPALWLSAGAVAERGIAPEIAVGPMVALGLQAQHWRVALAGSALPISEATATSSHAGARFRFSWLELQLCARLAANARPRVGGGVCGLARQVWAQALGTGVDESLRANVQSQVLGLSPHLSLRVYEALGLESAIDFEWALRRPNYVIENLAQPVYRTPRFGGALRLAISVVF